MCSLYLHKRTGIRTKAAEDLEVWGIYGRDGFLLPAAAAQTTMPPDKEGYKGKELAGSIPLYHGILSNSSVQ